MPGANFHKDGPQVIARPWSGGFVPGLPYRGLSIPRTSTSLCPRISRHSTMPLWTVGCGGVTAPSFRNFGFLKAPGIIPPGPPVAYMTLRIWRPLGPDKMGIWSWFLVEVNAPEVWAEASYGSYVLQFGTSGTLEQDDTEYWSSIIKVSKGTLARRVPLSCTMGLRVLKPLTDWLGPGTAYPIEYTGYGQRHLWGQYLGVDDQ